MNSLKVSQHETPLSNTLTEINNVAKEAESLQKTQRCTRTRHRDKNHTTFTMLFWIPTFNLLTNKQIVVIRTTHTHVCGAAAAAVPGDHVESSITHTTIRLQQTYCLFHNTLLLLGCMIGSPLHADLQVTFLTLRVGYFSS